LGRLKRCYHHTVVVLDRKPTPTLLREYLFHLKRAYGQKNRPPPLNVGEERPSTDSMLRPRSNRYIGMSREGTVSLSWPSKDSGEEDYEVEKWHKVFLGIYLILAIHVQGEKAILLELSNLSAHAGSLLKQIAWDRTHKHEETLPGIVKLRTQLGSLAALMTRYTLQMSSDNCGGLSEYVEFFTTLRTIFGIRNQRNELREEIQDVLALVESSYLEEQRKYAELSTFYQRQEKRQNKIRDAKASATQNRNQNIISVVSIFTLPIMILSGLFGMNNSDLPTYLHFLPCLFVTISISFVLLIIFVLIVWERKPPPAPETSLIVPRISLSLDGEPSFLKERFSVDPSIHYRDAIDRISAERSNQMATTTQEKDPNDTSSWIGGDLKDIRVEEDAKVC